jgi:hypothetical protein
MDDRRDVELGRRLDLLEEPEHGAPYWDDLRAAVAAEHPAPVRNGFLAIVLDALRTRSVRWAALATGLVVFAAAALLIGLPRPRGPEPVSADVVLRRALAAYSSGRTWQADALLKTIEWNRDLVGFHYVFTRFHLAQRADGSYRLAQVGKTRREGFAPADAGVTDVLAYDAATGTLRHYRPRRGLTVTRGTPPGAPDALPNPLTGVDFGTGARAMQASGAFRLSPESVDGRAAWTVTCTLGTMVAGASPPPSVEWPVYKVTTDGQTWLPLWFRQISGGVLIADLRYVHVRYDAALPAHAFTVIGTEPRPVWHADRGFRQRSLGVAARTPGVLPLVPGFVPRGFRLAQTAVASHALTANHVVRGAHVFELEYRHGFDALTVATRTIDDPYYAPDEDPFDYYDPQWTAFARTRARITSGAFAGATASIVVATTSSTPHLWAVKDGVLLTIGGGATARELMAVADSLERYPAH